MPSEQVIAYSGPKPKADASDTPPGDPRTILSARQLMRTFRMGQTTSIVLQGLDLAVRAGEFVAIEGRSGTGKSTLLHLLGALDAPDDGQVLFEGADIAKLPPARRAAIRNRSFGFVFQFYHLLPELNVTENTLLAPMISKGTLAFWKSRKSARERAHTLLKRLGLGERLHHPVRVLSGGERQRVAVARALMNEPAVLFADEPTGNLDTQTGRGIMQMFEELHAAGQTIVMVTHDRTIAGRADRSLVLDDGKLHAAH